MERFFGYSRQLDLGDPVAGATIEIFEVGTLNLVSIYSDDLSTPSPKANPFIADAAGYFFFYAADGRYDIRISGGPIADPIPTPFTWGDVLLGRGDYILRGTTTWDPPSLTTGFGASTTVTVAGALAGMPALASLSTLPNSILLLTAHVSSPNTVTVVLYNPSGGTINVGIGNLNVQVFNTKP